MTIFGYFDDSDQATPVFDPGLDALCPHCLHILQLPVMTISLMREGSRRSYFYRVHRHCQLHASGADIHRIESALIDSDIA